MPMSLRECVQNVLRDEDLDDRELYTEIQYCMEQYFNSFQGISDPVVDPYASMQRGDTEEYNPDNDIDGEQAQPDQMIGGKKSRRRRHRLKSNKHKSRRSRRKSHKRK